LKEKNPQKHNGRKDLYARGQKKKMPLWGELAHNTLVGKNRAPKATNCQGGKKPLGPKGEGGMKKRRNGGKKK